MTEYTCFFDMDIESLIQVKDQKLRDIESKYFKLLARERELKGAENNLYLKTDFKAQGLTNEKMRNAFVSDAVSSLRFELDHAKYELKQQEDVLIILNDLIALRMQEVKPK